MIIILFVSCSDKTDLLKDEITAVDKAVVLSEADSFLIAPVKTVTDTSCERSAGGLHDYFSEGTYWWPDSTNPDGPYNKKRRL
ncbi:MAG: hypothetical protein PVH88_14705 [Ignavibacteria bacterium]